MRFDEGLEQTVAWYRDNAWWWEPIRSGDYRAYYERQYGRPSAEGQPTPETFHFPPSFTSDRVLRRLFPWWMLLTRALAVASPFASATV